MCAPSGGADPRRLNPAGGWEGHHGVPPCALWLGTYRPDFPAPVMAHHTSLTTLRSRWPL
jgi:hypothetical protein